MTRLMSSRKPLTAKQMRIVGWTNGVAAALFWIAFAKSSDWWLLAAAIAFTFIAVGWAIKAKRSAAT